MVLSQGYWLEKALKLAWKDVNTSRRVSYPFDEVIAHIFRQLDTMCEIYICCLMLIV